MKRLTLLLLLAACGGAQTGEQTNYEQVAGSTGPAQHDPGAHGDCQYTLEDGCIDEAALEACHAASAECPGQVQVMESCPLQFSCGGAANPEPNDQGNGAYDPDFVPCTEGETRSEDCNTCSCEDGVMACTELDCE